MKLSVIIPVYNEERYIDTIIKKVKEVTLPDSMGKEIIVIDDKSTDRTAEILKKYRSDPDIRILSRRKNKGKSQAVHWGIKESTGDIILIQDADLEYDPKFYPRLIKPIIQGQCDVVYGSRFKGSIKNMKFINRVANILSNVTLNLLFFTGITDINTCHKVFKRKALQDIKLVSGSFMFETEVTVKLLKKGYTISEVPIDYVARTKQEGKKITWPRALHMYWGIIKYKFEM